MQKYNVTGMSCAACSARVEKAVSALPDVTQCSVNLLTGSMQVNGSADAAQIIAAVEKAGYGASPVDTRTNVPSPAPGKNDTDDGSADLLHRLIASVCVLFVLMYVSMGHSMAGLPLPAVFADHPASLGLLQMMLASVVLLIHNRFFVSGFRAVLHRAPNMDTLVAMGSGAAFVYSICVLFEQIRTPGMPVYYFESAAMIVTLITVGKFLEAKSKGRTTDALKSLVRLKPHTATVLRDGREVTVPIESVKRNEIVCIRPGERIPVDGVIVEGSSAVDESTLTGESIPVDKNMNDSVFASTVNTTGFLRCRVTQVGEDTTLAQIIRMVQDASAGKAPIARIADKVSGVFVPVVLAIALIATVIWLLCGQNVGFALARGITVLVISCPCALGLATPVAIMVGSGMGAKQGTLFKTAAALEETGKINIVAFDKTGTLTEGRPQVTDILPQNGVTETELLRLAAALECKSEHPLAKAILACAQEHGCTIPDAEQFEILPGSGLHAVYDGQELRGGSAEFLRIDMTEAQAKLAEDGKTPLFFALGNKTIGCIAVADMLRTDSIEAIRELRSMGLRTVMLTGDNKRTAKAVAAKAGVDDVIAQLLPGDKEKAVRTLQKDGKTAMVGDGVNDAPALTVADIGIAVGSGTDIAVDAADVVLLRDGMRRVPDAIRLSRAVLRNIRQNLFWAFFYNAIGIPLAAGALIPLLGWELPPMFGAAAMSLSSFCVCMNALRLNFFRPYSYMKPKQKPIKETKPMEKTLKIEGMMCGHCEMHVKKALEALEQVDEAVVSHEKGTAVLRLNSAVADETLKAAVEAEGYKVI